MFIVFLMNVMNIFCKKYIKMGNKEQDFINRYKDVQESIVKAMDKALEREREINPPEYDIEVHVVREKDVF